MPKKVKSDGDADQRDRQVQVAEHAEQLQDDNEPDSFPEEGTDEKMVQARDTGNPPFSDDEAVRATEAVIASGLSAGGKTSADWPDGQQPAETLDDGTNKPGGADDSSDLNDKDALSNSDVSASVHSRGLTGGNDMLSEASHGSDTQERDHMEPVNATAGNTAQAAPAQQGSSLLNKLPFSEHLNKLPAPVRDFVQRRPAAAAGIGVLAVLGLMVAKRR